MRSLLLVAHGSRRKESNEEIRVLAEQLAEKATTKFSFVSHAFLEIAEPSIPDGIRICAAAGATEIIIFPYFLSAGVHIVSDIPREVEIMRKEYPDIEIKISEYLGQSKNMPDILLNMVA